MSHIRTARKDELASCHVKSKLTASSLNPSFKWLADLAQQTLRENDVPFDQQHHVFFHSSVSSMLVLAFKPCTSFSIYRQLQ